MYAALENKRQALVRAIRRGHCAQLILEARTASLPAPTLVARDLLLQELSLVRERDDSALLRLFEEVEGGAKLQPQLHPLLVELIQAALSEKMKVHLAYNLVKRASFVVSRLADDKQFAALTSTQELARALSERGLQVAECYVLKGSLQLSRILYESLFYMLYGVLRHAECALPSQLCELSLSGAEDYLFKHGAPNALFSVLMLQSVLAHLNRFPCEDNLRCLYARRSLVALLWERLCNEQELDPPILRAIINATYLNVYFSKLVAERKFAAVFRRLHEGKSQQAKELSIILAGNVLLDLQSFRLKAVERGKQMAVQLKVESQILETVLQFVLTYCSVDSRLQSESANLLSLLLKTGLLCSRQHKAGVIRFIELAQPGQSAVDELARCLLTEMEAEQDEWLGRELGNRPWLLQAVQE